MPSPHQIKILHILANALFEAELRGVIIGQRGGSAQAYFARMLIGLANGIEPMTAVANITVSEGGYSMRTGLKLALARRRGVQLELVTRDAKTAVVEVRRPEWPAGQVQRVSFTAEDADRAGLSRKRAWMQYPADMLVHRAISRALNLYAQDITIGMGYTHAEVAEDALDDMDVMNPEWVQPPPSGIPRPQPAAPPNAAPPVEAPRTPDNLTAPTSPDTLTETRDSAASDAPPATASPAAPSEPPAEEAPVTPEAQIRALVKQLGIDQLTWRTYCNGLGVQKLAEMTPEQQVETVAYLELLEHVRQLRNVVGIDAAQWAAIVAKRGVAHELLMSPAELQIIYDRIWQRMTPFDRERAEKKLPPPTVPENAPAAPA